jgi:beta-glucuronidase
MDSHFYRACDKAGVMVWIEPNVYCLYPGDDEVDTEFVDPEYRLSAKQMIVEMIANARNHPSVVIYGIGNECNTTNPEAGDFFRMLASTIRESDTTRLVSYAALYGRVGTLADIVDILGINSYWGWYDKCFGGKGLAPEERDSKQKAEVPKEPIDLTEMRKMLDGVIEAAHAGVALLLTEFGADSVPGNLSESRELWSENYHADLLKEIFVLADEYPQIVGTSPFCFCDYRDPSKIINGYWNEINLKGVVGYNRKPKMAFDALKSIYTKN